MAVTIRRDVLHEAIDKLPDSALKDLARFIEFLQFKAQEVEQNTVLNHLPEVEESPINEIQYPSLYNPVYFPEGVLPEFDFSPEYIKEARQEFWVDFGEGFE